MSNRAQDFFRVFKVLRFREWLKRTYSIYLIRDMGDIGCLRLYTIGSLLASAEDSANLLFTHRVAHKSYFFAEIFHCREVEPLPVLSHCLL